MILSSLALSENNNDGGQKLNKLGSFVTSLKETGMRGQISLREGIWRPRGYGKRSLQAHAQKTMPTVGVVVAGSRQTSAFLSRFCKMLPTVIRHEAPEAIGAPDFKRRSLSQDESFACAYIASGKRMINPSRFGICTLGSVCAFTMSFSSISLFCAKI